jgi:hydroxyethylthiazole kinase-like sugar kinase family protein
MSDLVLTERENDILRGNLAVNIAVATRNLLIARGVFTHEEHKDAVEFIKRAALLEHRRLHPS